MKNLLFAFIALFVFSGMSFGQKSLGEKHNDDIKEIMSSLKLKGNESPIAIKDLVYQAVKDKYKTADKELLELSMKYKNHYQYLDAIKNKISNNFYEILKQDLDNLIPTNGENSETYFKNRFKEVNLNANELQMYKSCSTVFTSSVELWSSKEGAKYLNLLSSNNSAKGGGEPNMGGVGAADFIGAIGGIILGGIPGAIVTGVVNSITYALP